MASTPGTSVTSQRSFTKITPKLIVRIEISKCKIRSTKFEIRNNNKIQIFEFSKHVFDFGHLILGFVWHFDIRISDLECCVSVRFAIV
jgi:hypothetical protein